jgi:hypothetical protein
VLWLLDTMTVLLQVEHSSEFVKCSRWGLKPSLPNVVSNCFGCFLTVAAYRVGSQRVFVIILKGRGGRGWLGFTLELCRFLYSF